MHNDRVKELEATVARQREQIIDYTHTNIELRRQVTTAKDYSFAGLASVFGNFVACVTTLAAHGLNDKDSVAFNTTRSDIMLHTEVFNGFKFIITLHIAKDGLDTTTLVAFLMGHDYVLPFESEHEDTSSTEFAWDALSAFMEACMYPHDLATKLYASREEV